MTGGRLHCPPHRSLRRPVGRALVFFVLPLVLSAGSGVGGCATGASLPPAEEELDVDQVGAALELHRTELGRCYDRERMRPVRLGRADYLAELTIGPQGGAPAVRLTGAATPGLDSLESCLVRVLGELRFAAHSGPPLRIDVPIRAPRP